MINPYREMPGYLLKEKWIESVEKALGFKLFFWQKTYIETGHFRQYGATTAQILKELSELEAPTLDYRKRPRNQREDFYRNFLREIKGKLDEAGIPTREVWFCEADRKRGNTT